MCSFDWAKTLFLYGVMRSGLGGGGSSLSHWEPSASSTFEGKLW